MFNDFAPRLAQVLTEYSLPIQKGDYVAIIAPTAAEPLIVALYEAIVRRGGYPLVQAGLPGLQELFFRYASDEQLDFCDPTSLFTIGRVDALFQIIAPFNTKANAGIDVARLARRQKGARPITEKYFERINDQSLRWNITAWPTAAAAQEAEMGLLAYTEFVYKACGLDHADPVAFWSALRTRQDRLVAWLTGKHHVEVKGTDVELSLDVAGRNWVNCWGSVNFPDGEIFTSPLENSVNGHVEFNYPTVLGGREVEGVKITFKDGVAVDVSARKNESYLLSQLNMDEGARRLGEFAIGTNMGIQQFTGETLFDEKIGGSIHMALGESIQEAGGINKSQIHWDMVHSMRNGGEIWVDGELFYKNGEFVVG
jgi:aminopeptidase